MPKFMGNSKAGTKSVVRSQIIVTYTFFRTVVHRIWRDYSSLLFTFYFQSDLRREVFCDGEQPTFLKHGDFAYQNHNNFNSKIKLIFSKSLISIGTQEDEHYIRYQELIQYFYLNARQLHTLKPFCSRFR